MSKVEQPYAYVRRELVEPDWTRLPGWAGVTQSDWDSAQWQRFETAFREYVERQPVG